MAIQFVDPGGEYYFSSGLSAPGVWNATLSASLTASAPAGRSTTYGILMANNTWMEVSLGANFSEEWMGGAFYVPSGSFINGTILFAFFDTATSQCDVRINSTGNLLITRAGTTLGTSSNALVTGSGWHYFEFRAKIATGTGGSAEVWVDQVQWLSVTSVNTAASGASQTNRARWEFFSNSGASTGYWKDMYILDTGTGANTTRLGDITVSVLFPNSAGPSQQWSNTGGATQLASVQDGITHTGTWPDGDTSYISDSVSGHISDFGHQGIGGSGTIFAAVHVSYVRSDVGAATFKQYTKSGATVHTTAALGINTTYNYFFDVLEKDPATSAAWSTSGLNAATNGVQIP